MNSKTTNKIDELTSQLEEMTEKYHALKKRNNEMVRMANDKVASLKQDIERLCKENLTLKSELNKIKFSAQQEEKEISEPRITLKSQSEINYNEYIH